MFIQRLAPDVVDRHHCFDQVNERDAYALYSKTHRTESFSELTPTSDFNRDMYSCSGN